MSMIVNKLQRIKTAKDNALAELKNNGISLGEDIESYPDEIKQKVPYGIQYSYGNHVVNGVWQKPEDWPDIESISLSAQDNTVYFLYGNNIRANSFCRLKVTCTGTTEWHIGNVVNGVFSEFSQADMKGPSSTNTGTGTATSTATPSIPTSGTVTNGGIISIWLSDFYCDYTVLKINSVSASTANKLNCVIPQEWNSGVTSINGSKYSVTEVLNANTCLMRYGNLKYCSNISFTSYYLESDNLLNVGQGYSNTAITVSNAYASNFSLQRFRKTGWNLGKGATCWTTSMGSMFQTCRSLIDADLDFTGFITSATTTCTNIFNGCNSLRGPINVTDWDLLKCTTASSIFNSCYALTSIIGIDTWKNFFPKTLTGIFYNCYNLKKIDFNEYITSACTIITSMFYGCNSIKEINLIGSDFSKVTTCSGMFYNCFALENLNMSHKASFSNVCTSYNQMFYNCTSLKEICINDWDFTNATMLGMFYGCNSVRKISLSGCTTNTKSQSDSSAGNAIIYGGLSYIRELDLSSLDYSKMSSTYGHLGFNNNNMLSDFYPPQNLKKPIQLTYSYSLSHDSLLRIIDNLSAVTTTTTLTLGTYNYSKLTSTEIALATNKGWTVTK